MQDAQRLSGAKPAFSNLFKVLKSMDKVADGVLLREIEEVNGAGGMGDIDSQVDDLAQAMGALVKAEELGNDRGSVGTESPRGYV